MAPVEVHVFPVHIVIDRCLEIAGRWNAHCLELDLMTWHATIPGALETAREAIESTLVEDLAHGWDPMRRTASREEWDALYSRLRKAQANQMPVAGATEPEFVIVETTIRITHVTADGPAVAPEFTAPVTFVPAAVALHA